MAYSGELLNFHRFLRIEKDREWWRKINQVEFRMIHAFYFGMILSGLSEHIFSLYSRWTFQPFFSKINTPAADSPTLKRWRPRFGLNGIRTKASNSTKPTTATSKGPLYIEQGLKIAKNRNFWRVSRLVPQKSSTPTFPTNKRWAMWRKAFSPMDNDQS